MPFPEKKLFVLVLTLSFPEKNLSVIVLTFSFPEEVFCSHFHILLLKKNCLSSSSHSFFQKKIILTPVRSKPFYNSVVGSNSAVVFLPFGAYTKKIED
jgi:hypothetical protein